MKRIAVVLLNYNSSADCDKCIEFLLKQTYPIERIIVIDNNSSISDVEVLKRVCNKSETIELILNKENRGFSAGNNIGLIKATELAIDWCLVINPDVELRDENYIDIMLREIEKWPEIVLAGSNIVLPSGEWQNPQRESTFYESFFWPIESIKRKIFNTSNNYLCERVTGYCEKLCGACFFVCVDFIRAVNYMDENIFLYSEEAVLSAKVKMANKRALYVNETTAYHEHYATKKASSRERMIKFIDSRLYYYEKYGDLSRIKLWLIKLSLMFEKAIWKHRR